MGYIPLFMSVSGKPCLVIGGGDLAEARVKALRAAGAVVTVIAEALTAELRAMVEAAAIEYRARPVASGDLAGFALVYYADTDDETGRRVAAEAHSVGVPINVMDRPDLCSLIMPAVVSRGSLQIAISTSGASPALARMIREELEATFGPEYELLLGILERARRRLREQQPDANRRVHIARLLAIELRDAILHRDHAAADRVLSRFLGVAMADLEIDPGPAAQKAEGAGSR
jgi:siroheme synthase-like protein